VITAITRSASEGQQIVRLLTIEGQLHHYKVSRLAHHFL